MTPFVQPQAPRIQPGRYRVIWVESGRHVLVRVRRRWFPWPSRNVTFGHTIYEGGPGGMNQSTFQRELAHVWQYESRGWWWVLTHPRAREREAGQWEEGVRAIWVRVRW